MCKNIVGMQLDLRSGSFIAFKAAAMAGFIASATLLIGFNFKTLNKVIEDKSITYWCLFFTLSIVPLLLIIYFFNLFFTRRVYF